MLSVVLPGGWAICSKRALPGATFAEQRCRATKTRQETHPHGEGGGIGGKLDPWRQWPILGVVQRHVYEPSIRYGGGI